MKRQQVRFVLQRIGIIFKYFSKLRGNLESTIQHWITSASLIGSYNNST